MQGLDAPVAASSTSASPELQSSNNLAPIQHRGSFITTLNRRHLALALALAFGTASLPTDLGRYIAHKIEIVSHFSTPGLWPPALSSLFISCMSTRALCCLLCRSMVSPTHAATSPHVDGTLSMHDALNSSPSHDHSHSQTDSLSADPRKYVSHACEACRSRRSKCDGKLPVCSTCQKRRTACTYSAVDRRRGKLKKHETDALVQQVETLQGILSALQISPEEDALELLKKIRRHESSLVDFWSASGRPSPVSETLADYRRSQERDTKPVDQHPHASTPQIYTPDNLPPLEMVRLGIAAYYNCCFTLFYLFQEQHIYELVRHMYQSEEPVDTATLCEVCALAAVGSQYDADHVPQPVMEAFYRTASVYMHDCVEAHYLRGMRMLLCLSIYSFMTKRSSARLSIASGIQIARWARLHRQVTSHDLHLWRRVYRTLVFMECWLASSLGYQFDLTEEELNFAQLEIAEPVPSLENAIQAQMSAVGILMANILRDVYRSSSAVFSIVKKHARILDDWRRSLPGYMQLSAILDSSSENLEEKHRRSLVLVHIMGYGAQILLQRRLLVAMAECKMNKRWTLDGSREEGAAVHQECVTAAVTCVQLLEFLSYTGNMLRRCWLCIGHAFSACSVLLFEAAQSLLHGLWTGVEDTLAHSQKCIHVLQDCSVADHVAKTMVDIVHPLHEELVTLSKTDSWQTRRSGIYDLLQNPHPEHSPDHATDHSTIDSQPVHPVAIPAMQKAIDVLGNPFAHPRRLNIDSFSPADPDVPSWWN
ncbi:hypothetical protein HRR86_001966 [Exophiala dermatitidis]|nr:hypothetical protein HRR77_007769 [Exophiala dermatitidis]KAJ4544689.1 hypothetical protein HRR76_002737 [Exophiala dermatitidis]KAJ4606533.1 hypothetical protein HRR85_007303 [Exophiala dermatitidis]KAJ4632828.1 hypothetical protein HRR86_001966 [Exophiala dermatitidis]KAJ9000358.1 hypothetical protein HRR94_004939 [Exophiala dermatitidis]